MNKWLISYCLEKGKKEVCGLWPVAEAEKI